ncbi:alpha/beta fold hydrolase [Novosphingobium sp. 9]|uniref:alpha/beta fold hydrolase n=1 Tax=Novosphingobium sp. 9 TaxID=2025349 RepID=UPI0021B653BC|nr:alpha/beta hydrolase [Novosphingobium sp. 9]
MPVLPELAQDRVVIAADTPGYGMSDAPPAPVAIEDFAEEMAALMTYLAGIGEIAGGAFDVMGYHTGSVTTTELARRFPDRVRKAVVFGLAAYPADLRAQKLARLGEVFPVPDATLHHVEKLWAIMRTLIDERMSAEDLHVAMAQCLSLGHRMTWGYESVYKYDFLRAMAEVRQPVLVMNPQDDLWDVTHATSHLFPHGQRHDMPGVSHGILKLETLRVVRVVDAFLRDS